MTSTGRRYLPIKAVLLFVAEPLHAIAMRLNRQIIEEVMRWAEDRLADGLTVSAMAERAGYSDAHFSRLFLAVAGEPPGCWLTGGRVARAAECLRSANARVLDIALECGFADMTTFARSFRRRTGLSPSAYRRVARPAAERPAGLVREAGTVASPAFHLCGLTADVAADPSAPAALWQALRQKLADDGLQIDPQLFRQVAFWRGDAQARYTCVVGFVCDIGEELSLPFAILGIPAAVCRRFVVEHPAEGLAPAYEAIYGELLPATGDRLAADFVIERPRPDASEGVEIWVPIAGTVEPGQR